MFSHGNDNNENAGGGGGGAGNDVVERWLRWRWEIVARIERDSASEKQNK